MVTAGRKPGAGRHRDGLISSDEPGQKQIYESQGVPQEPEQTEVELPSISLGELASKHSELYKDIKRREAELKAVKAEFEGVRKGLLTYFEYHGIQEIASKGILAYLRRNFFARLDPERKEEAVAAIKRAGLGFLVKEDVNVKTLTSWVGELDEDSDGMPVLPPELQDLVLVSEVFEVRARKKP